MACVKAFRGLAEADSKCSDKTTDGAYDLTIYFSTDIYTKCDVSTDTELN